MTPIQEAAAFHGMAMNRGRPLGERLELALQALKLYEVEVFVPAGQKSLWRTEAEQAVIDAARPLLAFWDTWQNTATLDPGDMPGIASLLTVEDGTALERAAEAVEPHSDRLRRILAALDAVPGEPAEHPEARCGRCGNPNVQWVAPSPLWNAVMRGGDIDGAEQYDGIVCPTCFALLAEAAGVASGWRLIAQDIRVVLQTRTPSGRVWDEESWLWVPGEPEVTR